MSTEPYRYACPECASISLSPRTRDGGHRCDRCGHVMNASERVDRKQAVTGGA